MNTNNNEKLSSPLPSISSPNLISSSPINSTMITNSDNNDGEIKKKSNNIFEGDNSHIYNQFLGDNFNVVHYTSNALKVSSISLSLNTLTTCTRELGQELTENITTNYDDLFKLANNIKELDQLTDTLKLGVSNLEESIQRMKNDISGPYNKVKSHIGQLKRVQDSCELLRKVIRYIQLVKKLKNHLQAGSRDLSKSAQCINEINLLKKDSDLTGINIIDSQVLWIKTCSDQIITISSTLLYQGMENQNQTDVANSLQVFHNMAILNEKVYSVVNLTTEKVIKNIKALLNVNKLIADLPKTTIANSIANNNNNNITNNTINNNNIISTSTDKSIWLKFESLIDTLYSSLIQILHLQRVLLKIKDPITHKSLMEVLLIKQHQLQQQPQQQQGGTANTQPILIEMISTLFWKSILKVLENNLLVAAKSSNIIENTFIREYPKVSKFFLDFIKKLQNYIDIHQMDIQQQFMIVLSNINQIIGNNNSNSNIESPSSISTSTSSLSSSSSLSSITTASSSSSSITTASSLILLSADDYKLSLFKSISLFEKAYLEYSQSKMSTIVNGLFPQSAWSSRSTLPVIPNGKQLVDLSKTIWSEIEWLVGNNDRQLLGKLMLVVSKVIDLFSSKIESMVQPPGIIVLNSSNSGGSNEIMVINENSKPTPSQTVNTLLFNASIQLNSSIQSLLTSQPLERDSIILIEKSLNSLITICTNIITPLMNSFFTHIEQIFSTIHNEDCNEKTTKMLINKSNQTCSSYMESFKTLVNYFQNQYLVRFTPCQLLNNQIKAMISKIFIVYLKYCSLLKQPFSENGKLKMVNDLTHLEFAVTPLLVSGGIKEIGESYNLIRNYKQSIFN
ncbi:hypothetical protein ACTA71_000884 [Dictyostelium dimigraforme]